MTELGLICVVILVMGILALLGAEEAKYEINKGGRCCSVFFWFLFSIIAIGFLFIYFLL